MKDSIIITRRITTSSYNFKDSLLKMKSFLEDLNNNPYKFLKNNKTVNVFNLMGRVTVASIAREMIINPSRETYSITEVVSISQLMLKPNKPIRAFKITKDSIKCSRESLL